MRLGAVTVDPTAADVAAACASSAGARGGREEAPAAFLLVRRDGVLALEALAEPGLGRLDVDFTSGAVGWRGGARARQERLVRACRASAANADGSRRRIVDGTGGLGTDSWLLASAGATVVVLEQHPVLRLLLEDGLARADAPAPGIRARIEVRGGDARRAVAALAPDVLYVDPMYPPRRKQALGDRRLRLLGALLAADGLAGDDAAGLVGAGLDAGVPRVVLKCPARARIEGVPAPNHSLAGRSTRFDVWVGAPGRP